MSRLTPTQAGTEAELEHALDIVANRTWTCAQLSKLFRSLTVDDSDSAHAPDIDDMADEFHSADLANKSDSNESERYQMPYMADTLSMLEALGTKGCP
jgi:hypothetical protein